MPSYLRDQQVSDLTITSEALSRIVDLLFQRLAQMPEFRSTENPEAVLIMTIRFDEKGYRVFSKQDLIKYFEEARDVERVIFELHSFEALRTNKNSGSYLELRLDNHKDVTCFLTSSSDDEHWVTCSFNAVSELLRTYANSNSWARSKATEFFIQLLGVFAGFVLSLWGASKVAPNLQIENAFLISFLLVLIIFSNLWGLISSGFKNVVYKAFPKIKFQRSRKGGVQWLVQGLVTGFAVAAGLYFLNLGFIYVGRMLGMFVGVGT